MPDGQAYDATLPSMRIAAPARLAFLVWSAARPEHSLTATAPKIAMVMNTFAMDGKWGDLTRASAGLKFGC
jgi:hypothetical protein